MEAKQTKEQTVEEITPTQVTPAVSVAVETPQTSTEARGTLKILLARGGMSLLQAVQFLSAEMRKQKEDLAQNER